MASERIKFNIYREFSYQDKLLRLTITDPLSDERRITQYTLLEENLYKKRIHFFANNKIIEKLETIALNNINDLFIRAMLKGEDPNKLDFLKPLCDSHLRGHFEYKSNLLMIIKDEIKETKKIGMAKF